MYRARYHTILPFAVSDHGGRSKPTSGVLTPWPLGKLSSGNAHVGEIERGESNVTIQTLKIVADTLGTTITELVKGL